MASVAATTNNFILETSMSNTLSLLERTSRMVELKQIHAQMFKTGLILETIALSKLLAFASSPNSGNLPYALVVFERISKPNTFMWNSMIRGYANSNNPEKALVIYHQMICHAAPHNDYTFPFLLKACSSLSALEETQQIHARLIKLGFASHVYTINSLLHVYAMSGFIKSAQNIFDRIPNPDAVSWNSMINGYMSCDDIETSYQLFKNMPKRNAISFTIMISGHVQAGLYKEALDLFQEMQISGVKPDKVVLATAISACTHLGALDQGRWIHAYINKTGLHIDSILGCVLTDMYAKCGSMEEAMEVFKKLGKKNVSVWTAIIYGFAIHGHGREALHWFMQMENEGIKPNLITFTAVLTACSYAGFVDEGKLIFESMEKVYSLRPTLEHYGCMVDLLGRAGLVQEAKALTERMPVEPNPVIWGALLKACRIHGNIELGKQIGKILIEVDSDHGGRYIQLANIHAAAGEWDVAAEARKNMKESGVFKPPGCSTISVDGIVHEFLAGDRSHPQMEEIYCMWYEIAERLKQKGHKAATQNLLLDLKDEEKETSINQHSEKLAIALGLIRTTRRATIRIVKNLRVCEDCHMVMKLISETYDRVIVMRDRIRFHIFCDGKCSCGDYW